MSARAKRTTVHEAKTHLSRLIDRALRGEDVVIHRGPIPVVRLVPVTRAAPERKFGAMKGRFVVPDSFFEPLPDHELDAWER
jgi:prevent-host-death family protein